MLFFGTTFLNTAHLHLIDCNFSVTLRKYEKK